MKSRHGPATVMDRALRIPLYAVWEGVVLVMPKSGDLPMGKTLFITHEDEEVLLKKHG